ncbi:hypothetical protein DSO57_1012244 [Entomophthora muscae]|uniref:Uncharacterized protein n=1 Tax=Entomophthora muscae TaxID=34485 RepID=A0ACC2S8G0_9FUNG|nr:hypothetical protein DSO57_1012244 [Entomophthora muscae]
MLGSGRVPLMIFVFLVLAVCSLQSFDKLYEGYDKKLLVKYRTSSAEYRYWLFEAREGSEKAPLIFWINGIPDQPPIFGTSAGMSPCKLKKDLSCKPNIFAWNQHAHVLFFDLVKYITLINQQYSVDKARIYPFLFRFIRDFCQEYPHYVRAGIHIFGQSYDSIVAAVVGNMIFGFRDEKQDIKLLSVGLGSPIIDMRVQMKGYPETMKGIQKDIHVLETMKRKITNLHTSTRECAGIKKHAECKHFAETLFNVAIKPYTTIYPSLLDYRAMGYNKINRLIQKYKYLLLNTTSSTADSNYTPGTLLSHGEMCQFQQNIFESHSEEIKTLVNAKIPVLIFSGEYDYIANHHGMLALLNEMNWYGPYLINRVKFTSLPVYKRWSAYSLTYVLIKNAGHLTQVDQPETMSFVIKDWITQTIK